MKQVRERVTVGGKRRCWVCREFMHLSAFSNKKGTTDRHYVCKACCNRRAKIWYSHNRDRALAKRIEFSREVRASAIAAIGDSSCRCCGEGRKSMLDIDHINNDGHEHRKSGVTAVYRDVVKNPHKYQLLCCNCNQSKRRNGGACEHKTEWRVDIFDRFKRRLDMAMAQDMGFA